MAMAKAKCTCSACGKEFTVKRDCFSRKDADGSYYAYLVDDNAEIGAHYELTHTCSGWLWIYDDERRTFKTSGFAKEIRIYQAGAQGCIIQLIPSKAN